MASSRNMTAVDLQNGAEVLAGLLYLQKLDLGAQAEKKTMGSLIGDLFGTYKPYVDVDKDGYSPVVLHRGAHWRGRDCWDIDRKIHPGQVPAPDALVDSNCNGIHGKNSHGHVRMGTLPLLSSVFFFFLQWNWTTLCFPSLCRATRPSFARALICVASSLLGTAHLLGRFPFPSPLVPLFLVSFLFGGLSLQNTRQRFPPSLFSNSHTLTHSVTEIDLSDSSDTSALVLFLFSGWCRQQSN